MDKRFGQALGLNVGNVGQAMEQAILRLLALMLTPREATVVQQFYGIDCEAKTMDAIGVWLGEKPEFGAITRERVRQVRDKALRKLHCASQKKRIADILEEGRWNEKDPDVQELRQKLLACERTIEVLSLRLEMFLRIIAVAAAGTKNSSIELEPVEKLGLTTRTGNILKNAGIKTVPELAILNESELLKLPNMGRKSLNEIKEVLANRGLTPGMK